MSWDPGDTEALEKASLSERASAQVELSAQAWGEIPGVATKWADSVSQILNPPPRDPSLPPPTLGQTMAASVRTTQAIVGAVTGGLGMLQDMANIGIANFTNVIAAVLPAFPAASISMLYVGPPHAHSHPPSLIPPAPPVPLPSLGPILLGTCLRVLVGGMPAARAGDIGVAMTCVGFVPLFQIKTGSSNVFIGGSRAARMLDFCSACFQGDEAKTKEVGKGLAAVGAAARGAQAAIGALGKGAQVMGIAADASEAATDDDPAMAAAKALAAAMGAAQMASDLAAAALTKTMGKDPSIPPGSRGVVTLGMPTVMIGGIPMPNTPDPAQMLLGKLARYKSKPPPPKPPPKKEGCPTCPN